MDEEANVESGAAAAQSRVRAASQAHAAVAYVQEQVKHMHDKTTGLVLSAFRAAVSPFSFVVCSVPAVLGLFMFSAIGFGTNTIRFLNDRADLAPALTSARVS